MIRPGNRRKGTMTQIDRVKFLAILAVTLMILAPAFAIIDSNDSSASGGSQDVAVEDWDTFKKAMVDARGSPDITFNVNFVQSVTVVESITIPSNVKMTLADGTALDIDIQGSGKINLINEGEITLNAHEAAFGYSASIAVLGEGGKIINNGKITFMRDSTLMVDEGANLVNWGTLVIGTKSAAFNGGKLTNNNTVTINENSILTITGKKAELVNWGTINGDGALNIEDGKAVSMSTISCIVYGKVEQQKATWDAGRAGKTLSSEGFKLNLNTSQIIDALHLLGDVDLYTLIENFFDSMAGEGKTDVDSIDTQLALTSYFCEADYPNNMILRSAIFDATVNAKIRLFIEANVPAEGTYPGTTAPLVPKTLDITMNVTLPCVLRIDAYFDAGNLLQRVDISFGLGIKLSATTDLRINDTLNDDEYTIEYTPTRYDLNADINVFAGLDFNGFDLMAYNPGDQWDVKGKIEIGTIFGGADILLGLYTEKLIGYMYHDDPVVQDMLDNLYGGRTSIDFEELFEMLFGPIPKTGSSISSAAGATMLPTNDPAGGLFGRTFLFTASAEMDDGDNVILTRGPGSAGSLDFGEILFDTLEAEGESSYTMSSEVNGDSMESFLAGITVMLTGMGTQEQAEDMLKSIGAEYNPADISMKDMDRMYDNKMAEIDRMVAVDDENGIGFYIILSCALAIAALILITTLVKRD